jgi:ATP-dependent Lon protease
LIAAPILSRFTVLEINRPSAQQMEQVVRSIYQKIRPQHAWGAMFKETLPPAVISKLLPANWGHGLCKRN